HVLDNLQPFFSFLQRIFFLFNLSGKLVYCRYPMKFCSADGNMFYTGIYLPLLILRRNKDSCAQHKGAAFFNAKSSGYSLYGLLYPENLCSGIQKDPAGFHSQVQHFFVIVFHSPASYPLIFTKNLKRKKRNRLCSP